MQKSIFRKGMVLGIILLFVGAGILPSIGGTIIEKHSSIDNKTSFMGFNLRDPTWYVDDGGGADFTKIQDAINVSSDGDTVFVYSGIYYEHNVSVDKSINLIGEDKNSTIIDGESYNSSVVVIIADWVNISGFTIRNCGKDYMWSQGHWRYSTLEVKSNYNHVFGNIFNTTNENYNWIGIRIWDSASNTTIDGNIFYGIKTKGMTGIFTYGDIYTIGECNNNTISNNILYNADLLVYGNNNIITKNVLTISYLVFYVSGCYNTVSYNIVIYSTGIYEDGFLFRGLKHSNIYGNFIQGSLVPEPNQDVPLAAGFWLDKCFNVSIYQNTISRFDYGMRVYDSYNITFHSNDILECTFGIIFEFLENESFYKSLPIGDKPNNLRRNNFRRVLFPARILFREPKLCGVNIWEENYWNRPRLIPKIIVGMIKFFENWGIPAKFQFDIRPANKPYTIPKVAIKNSYLE